ncbi:MAG TPA: HAMP domain-containing sensor histidine kinase [Verrucomicrobiota bacterium]|nr:HAMP domain-containing sensor histidine kinase [Verrucomicrobiota bacterium]
MILLPVLIIAAVALTAIIENRAAVERESRRRAEEVARQYSKELERPWGNFLIHQDIHSRRWSDHLVEVVGAWPGSKSRSEREIEAVQFPDTNPRAQLAEWRALFPGWEPEAVFPATFRLTAEGRFGQGLEFDPAPQPPAWFTGLSSAQRAAWDALKAASAARADAEEIEQRIAQFQETDPESEASLNAASLGLRSQLTRLPPAEAVAQALRSAQENRETLSEAGLPLANLAFGEALRYARAAGPSEPLWEAIPDQVLRAPSPLIPALLDQLGEIAGTNSTLQTGVAAWRMLWDARLKLHDIAEQIRQTGKLRGVTTANFWIERDQTRWLCILNPERSLAPTPAGQLMAEPANAVWTTVRFLPKSVAEQALARALENSQVKLPNYLGLAVWLEGERLSLPARWSPGRGTNAAPLMLAEANGNLSAPGKLQKAPGEPEIDYEGYPSRPRFVLQLYVADQALMFATYRRHALLLAGLVAASAFAALLGVIASWRAFQRQLRLNELKSNFVSSVSHELRAPIASVRLMAESLERGKVPETPRQQEYFRFIVQECRRLSSLIENVLDFSRIEQGRKQYDFEPTDLIALTQQTVKLMQTYAAERGVNLQLRLPGPEASTLTPQLAADGKALQQALVNLIDNALKHSPKGQTVTVGLEEGLRNTPPRNTQHATALLLWVEDHGEGIPASEHERIFERFYRRGSELRRQTQGVGIGLSIVKHIVEAHGGQVVVRSAPGQGSRFTIELPVPSATANSDSRSAKPE